MTEETRLSIEQMTGTIEDVEKLDEQGGTSTVYQVKTKTGKYLLKTATRARYQEWLAEEAIVLEEWMQREPGFLPEYVGFFKDRTAKSSIDAVARRDDVDESIKTGDKRTTDSAVASVWNLSLPFSSASDSRNVGCLFNGTTHDGRTLCRVWFGVRNDGFTRSSKRDSSTTDQCVLDSW